MKDGQHSDEKTSDDAHVRPEATTGVKNPRDHQPASENTNQQESAPDHSVRLRDLPTFDRITRIITLLGLTATIGTLAVNYYELKAIQGQLTAAVEANSQYKRQADAAENSLNFAKTSSLTIDRPWMFASINPLVYPQTPQDFEIIVKADNYGRGPALAAKGLIKSVFSAGEAPAFDEEECETCEEYLEAPNRGFEMHQKFAFSKIPADQYEKIRDDTVHFYIVGRIDYQDSNNLKHKTIFCQRFKPEVLQFGSCERQGSNSAD